MLVAGKISRELQQIHFNSKKNTYRNCALRNWARRNDMQITRMLQEIQQSVGVFQHHQARCSGHKRLDQRKTQLVRRRCNRTPEFYNFTTLQTTRKC